jgi:acyl carrier protein
MNQKLDELMLELFPDEGDAVSADTPFRQYASWDSLKHVHLVVGIESRFAIELTADEVARLESRQAVADLLQARGAE